jgi:uncharacterized protein YndB with AHSA1/START domain
MTGPESSMTQDGEREFVTTRVVDAPRELVFNSWTEREHLLQWWGLKTWKSTYCTVDLRPGGTWHYCFRSAEGQESWGKATYHEITPPERLVYTDAFSDADGSVFPPQMLHTVAFAEQDGKTLVTLTIRFETEADRDKILGMGLAEGLAETLDCLEEHLAAAQLKAARPSH